MMEYETNDMWLAAVLQCSGIVLKGLRGGRNQRKTFILKGDAGKLLQITSDYYKGAARVDPRELRHRFTDLKGFMSSRAVPTTKRKDQERGASSNEDHLVDEREKDTSSSAAG